MPTVNDLLVQAQQALQAGDFGRSESNCRHILTHIPDYGPAWRLLGSVYFSTGRPADALKCHLKAAELLPNEAEVYHDLGYTFHSLDRLPEAADAYRRALELEPSNTS